MPWYQIMKLNSFLQNSHKLTEKSNKPLMQELKLQNAETVGEIFMPMELTISS